MIYKLLILFTLSFFVMQGCGEENSSSSDQQVEVQSEENTTFIPVEAMEISERLIEQKFPLTGVLTPINSVDLVAEVSGKIISVKKELGEYVSSNQTLATIDDVIPESQYKQAQAQVLSTESNLSIAEANLKSDKILFENGDISELEFNNSKLTFNNAEAQHLSSLASLSAAKKSYEDTRIKSPISGLISRKNIDFGTMASIGNVVYRIVDLSKLKLNVSVPQEIINRVRIGGSAIITISALNNEKFEGIVKRISPQADEITGGFIIEIHVTNKNNVIKAGMTSKAELLLSKQQKVLAIPEYALVSKDDENYVYKISNDIAELVKIDLGESIGNKIIVSDGLKNGDKIVVVGMKNLGIKTKVKIEKFVDTKDEK